MQPYGSDFFDSIAATAIGSARAIVPRLIELVQPRSVVDVGCGTGHWLLAFTERGVQDVLGIDGAHVPPASRQLPPPQFHEHDLNLPLHLERRFDLVLSLEVAEHLNAAAASTFVDSLVRLGPVVAFSAAAPLQGGTHHVNEQWPSYWAKLFSSHGYAAIDCLRAAIWNHPEVAWYYAQNLLLFASAQALAASNRLRQEQAQTVGPLLPLIHPTIYLQRSAEAKLMADAAEDLSRLVEPGEPFIFVDQEKVRPLIAVGSRAIPFLERDGQYWGAPPDDQTAIAELQRLRDQGARKLVIAWPAFWWIEHYREFYRHLSERFGCIMRNERFIAFDLTQPPGLT
jgi:SAM-dependent methyltransferase